MRRRKKKRDTGGQPYNSALHAVALHAGTSRQDTDNETLRDDEPSAVDASNATFNNAGFGSQWKEYLNGIMDSGSVTDQIENFFQDYPEDYDSSDYSSDEWDQVGSLLGDSAPEASSAADLPPEELLNTDPAALAEKLELLGTRQQDVRRTMRRLGRLQSATLETLPDFEKARKRMAYNGMAEDFRWLAFGWMGEGPLMIIPRLLMLWVIGLPLLVMRLALSLVVLYLTLGVPTMVLVGVSVGVTVPLQMYYRDVLKWAMHNDTFQDVWDAVASALAIALALLVYAIRLLVEIHNGFCPFWVLIADVLYEVAIQLTVIWYAAPALQYMALWILRLFVFLLEPTLDLLVTIVESFMFLVVETVSVIGSIAENDHEGIRNGSRRLMTEASIRAKRAEAMGLTPEQFEVHCAEHPEDQMCWVEASDPNADIGNVGRDAAGAMRSQGEMLLEIVSIVLITLIRVIQAFLIAFMPIIYSFFRMVLPVLLRLFPIAFELVGALAAILVSDPFKRILDYMIQAIPIILEVASILLCDIAIYLGSAACYILYGIVVYFGFYLKYIIRPRICGLGAFYGGCLEAFVTSMLDGQLCYSCGQYNTACGCRKATYPSNGCGSSCVEEGTNKVIPAPAPTESTYSPSNRSGHYGDIQDTNPLGDVVDNPDVDAQTKVRFGDDPDNMGTTGDSRFAAVPKSKGTQDSIDATDTGIGQDPSQSRRRYGPAITPLEEALRATPAPTPVPVPSGPIPAVPYQLTLSGSSHVDSDVVFLSSPGFYADLVMVEVPASEGEGTVLVPAVGSMPRYSPSKQGTSCINGTSDWCQPDDNWAAVSQQVAEAGSSFPGQQGSTAWEPALLAMRSSTHLQSGYTQSLDVSEAYTHAEYPWLQLHFHRGHRLTDLRLHWRASASILQAPEKMSITVLGAAGETLLEFTENRFCATNTATRKDIITVPMATGQLAYDVILTPIKSCAEAIGIVEFTSPYSLTFVEIDALGDALQLNQTSPLVPTSITVGNPALVHAHPGARLWDPCAQRSLARVVDNMVGSAAAAPLLISLDTTQGDQSNPAMTPLVGITFELWPGGRSDSSTEQQLYDVTLHLRGPTCISPEMALVCPYDPSSASATYPSTDTERTACVSLSGKSGEVDVRNTRDTRANLFRTHLQSDSASTLVSSVSSSWLNSSSGFYGEDWPGGHARGPPVRDCGYQFSTSAVNGMTTRGFVLWITMSALTDARPMDWQIAQLELGLDAAYATSAQWTQTVAQHLDSDGKQSNIATIPDLDQCPRVTSAHPIARQHWSTYTNAFGSSNTLRPWLAIDEVTARVLRPPADGLPGSAWSDANTTNTNHAHNADNPTSTGSRRLFTTVKDGSMQDSTDEVQLRRLLSEKPLSWEKIPDSVPLEDVLMVHSNPRKSGASEMGGNQPFYGDLSQMPDPALERQFDCFGYNISEERAGSHRNVTRVRCSMKARPLLAGTPTSSEYHQGHYSTESTDATAYDDATESMDVSVAYSAKSKELQTKLALHQDAAAKRAFLRQDRLEQLRTQQILASRPAQEPRKHTTSTSGSRQLLILGMDEVQDWVKGFVNSALSTFEGFICQMMGCSSYCSSDDGCDDSNLGDCFDAFVLANLESIFDCGEDPMVAQVEADAQQFAGQAGDEAEQTVKEGGDILSCLMRPVRDLFKIFIRHILTIFDIIASKMAEMMMLGDLVKMLACISCSITSIVTGVLMDFAQDFPVSLCASIVDKGEDQCAAWGMGGNEFGGAVFGMVWPLVKLSFGLIQVLPAAVEVVVEVTVVVFSGLLDVFPELMGDLFDVVMWFITSSELIATVEMMFEAFDPLLQETSADIGNKMKGATSKTSAAQPAQDVNANNPETCVRPGEAGGACGGAYHSNASGTAADPLRNTSKQQAAPITSESDLGFPLGGCGCKVQPATCADGADSATCPYQQGDVAKLMSARAKLYAELMANQTASGYNGTNPAECPDWPYCEGMTPRFIGKGTKASESGEFATRCVASKQCRMEFIGLDVNFNKATTIPFEDFSMQDTTDADGNTVSQFYRRSDRRRRSGIGCHDDPNRDSYHSTFKIPDVDCHPHRRRAPPPPDAADIQRRIARRLMGVEHLFSDQTDRTPKDATKPDTTSSPMDKQAEFEKAARGFETMVKAGNKSYAFYQVRALRREGIALFHLGQDAYQNASRFVQQDGLSRRVTDTLDYTGRMFTHTRKLLFGFSDSDAAEKIGCGWLDVEDYAPNTYPCCKGLWCCIPPPFPHDFEVDKEWFTWKDSWQQDTLCPYMETYPDGWLFLLRAFCKTVRDAAAGVISVWPYTSMVDAAWGFLSFPNDEWPESSTKMWTCVGLNISIYVVLLLIICGISYGWVYVVSFYSAHFVILQPLGRENRHMEVLFKRKYVPTGTMHSKRKTEFNANLDS